jgi:hypothetical protein
MRTLWVHKKHEQLNDFGGFMRVGDALATVLITGGYAHEAGAPFAPVEPGVKIAWRGLENADPVILPPPPLFANAAEYDSKVMTPKGKKHKKEDE